MRFVTVDRSSPLHEASRGYNRQRNAPSGGPLSEVVSDSGKTHEWQSDGVWSAGSRPKSQVSEGPKSLFAASRFQDFTDRFLDAVMPWTWRTDGSGRVLQTAGNAPMDYWETLHLEGSFGEDAGTDEPMSQGKTLRLVHSSGSEEVGGLRNERGSETSGGSEERPAVPDPFYVLEVCAPVRGRSFDPALLHAPVPFDIVLVTYRYGIAPIFLVCVLSVVPASLLAIVAWLLLISEISPLRQLLLWVCDGRRRSTLKKA